MEENIFKVRVSRLRDLMKREGIGLYYIPMDDCHGSEYVSTHFRCIEYVSGFTGSAGHVVITADGAWLWADGRYYIQAEDQLKGSGIELMKTAAPGVPDPGDFMIIEMPKILMQDPSLALAFDGSCVNTAFAGNVIDSIDKILKAAGQDPLKVVCDHDLAGEIWDDRPKQQFTKISDFDIKYSGEDTASKLVRIRKKLNEEAGARPYIHLISSLDDIAWIFNLRADDIPDTPECFAYAAIMPERAVIFLNEEMADENVRTELGRQGVEIMPYGTGSISYGNVCKITGAFQPRVVLMQADRINYLIYSGWKDSGTEVKDIKMPSALMKAIKNETELKNAKNALLRDCVRVTRFMKWLKTKAWEAQEDESGTLRNDDGTPITEITVDEVLTGMRAEDPLFMERSFATIAAYKENGAMMHYQAKPESHKELKAEGMLLVDSGAQYEDGTTDITRTFILGEITEEEKKAFTLTAAAMLRLANAKFMEGCTGENLDITAREPMWKEGWDYKCGTGHGVGHVLNVHEGPHRIHWRIGEKSHSAVLEKGMIVTDEPGVYRKGKYGIRTENELCVSRFTETEDGTFLQFEQMTFIPIDLDGIDKKYLSSEDVENLNKYHGQVYEKLAPFLDDESAQWLKYYTRAI